MFEIVLVNITVVSLVVIIHSWALWNLSLIAPKIKQSQFKLVFGVLGALVAHAVEIWIFAVTYYWMGHTSKWGELQGNCTGTLMDCVYFSFTTYSTLGYGDIVPTGHVRFLTGIESLTGLVLITWTASFLFIEMRRFWSFDEKKSAP